MTIASRKPLAGLISEANDRGCQATHTPTMTDFFERGFEASRAVEFHVERETGDAAIPADGYSKIEHVFTDRVFEFLSSIVTRHDLYRGTTG